MFTGSLVALVTPFHENLSVDLAALQELVEWHIEEGTDGIVVCGTTGENGALSEEEFIAVVETAIAAAKKRIPIIVGTGSLDTRKTVKNTEIAKCYGADGALVVLPYYNRPTEEGCVAHFQEAAKAGLPMIVYHHPGRTGIRLSPSDLSKIAKIPEVVAIKDAAGDLSHTLELLTVVDCPVLSGDDTLALPHLAAGCAGVVSIIANVIPKRWKEFIGMVREGQLEEGRKLFRELYGLARALVVETNPQGVKFALGEMGKCKPYLRLPLLLPRAKTQEEIRKNIPRSVESAWQ
jgi:4-hydroxy-tetrahydrodipicolinate synthase